MPEFTREQAWIVTACLLILATVALAAALAYTASAAVPFVLALLLSYLVAPMVDGLQVHLRVPRGAAIFVALLVIGAAAALLSMSLVSSVSALTSESDLYAARLQLIAEDTLAWVQRVAPGLLPPGVAPTDAFALGPDALQPLLSSIQATAAALVQAMSELLSNALLITISTVYLIAGRAPQQVQRGLAATVEQKVRIYLTTKFLTSAVTGLLTWLILAVLGLKLAFVFGMLAFLLNFIPTFGSIVAAMLPVPLALLEFPDAPGRVFAVLALPSVCQFVIGNLIEPKLMGDNLSLHPVAVLVNLIVWGILWGPLGLFLATPILAVLRSALEQSETTRPIALFLSGQLYDDLPE